MKQLTNITSDAIQTFTLLVGNEEATITLKYYPVTQIWCFDIYFRDKKALGVKISLGVLHINGLNFPFDFVAEDTSNLGIDPFLVNDFETGRINFYMLTADEIANFRGYYVEV